MFPESKKVTARESDAIHYRNFDPNKLVTGKFQQDDIRKMAFISYRNEDGTERRPIIQCPVLRTLKGLELKRDKYSMMMHMLGIDRDDAWGDELKVFKEKFKELDEFFIHAALDHKDVWFPSLKNESKEMYIRDGYRTIFFETSEYDASKYDAPLPGMVKVNFPKRKDRYSNTAEFTTNAWNIPDWNDPTERELIPKDEYEKELGPGYYFCTIGISCIYITKGKTPTWGVSIRMVDVAPYDNQEETVVDDENQDDDMDSEPVCSFALPQAGG